MRRNDWTPRNLPHRWGLVLLVAIALAVPFLVPGSLAASGIPDSLIWDYDPNTTGTQEGTGYWLNWENKANWWYFDNYSGLEHNLVWNNNTFANKTAVFGNSSGLPFGAQINVWSPINVGSIVFNSGANYTIAGNTLTLPDFNGTITANVDATISSPISTAWPAKYGSGTLTLTASNNISMRFDVFQGVLNLRNSNAIGSADAGVWTTSQWSGGTLELQDNIDIPGGAILSGQTWTYVPILRNVSGVNSMGGGLTLVGQTNINVTVESGSQLTIGGGIHGHYSDAPSLTKLGAGALIVNGPGDYPGTTGISGGILSINHNAGLGTADAGTEVSGGATLQIQGNLNIAAESLLIAGYGFNYGGALRSASGYNTWGGPITLYSYYNSNVPTIGVDTGSTLIVSNTISESYSQSLVKTGGGKLILTAPNAYTGSTYVAAGALNIRNNTALGAGNAAVSVYNGASLEMENNITVSGKAIQLAGNGLYGWGALRSATGSNTWNGDVLLDASYHNVTISVDGQSTLTINGTIQLLGGQSSLTKIYDGTLILTGNNTYPDATYINGGVVNVRHNAGLGSANAGTFVAYGASLEVQDGITILGESISLQGDGLQIRGALRNVSGQNSLTGTITLLGDTRIASDEGNLVLHGSVLGGGKLTKTGGGTLMLEGDCSYIGATTVSAGTLVVDGVIRSNTKVEAGARLNGWGVIHGAVTVDDGGTISAGQSPGHLTIADSSYQQNGTMLVEIAGIKQGGTYDWIEVPDSSATFGASAMLDINLTGGFNPAIGNSFDILTAGKGIANFNLLTFDFNDAPLNNGYWQASIVSLGGNAEALRLGVVPEPSTLALLVSGLLGLLAYAWRRRS